MLHSLHPYYSYEIEVAAETIAPGPFSTPLIIQTQTDGIHCSVCVCMCIRACLCVCMHAYYAICVSVYTCILILCILRTMSCSSCF